jgi:hypothetical protein
MGLYTKTKLDHGGKSKQNRLSSVFNNEQNIEVQTWVVGLELNPNLNNKLQTNRDLTPK